MIKFSLCIEPVLEKYDFYDRIKVAGDLGFDASEFWDPTVRDVAKVGRLLAENKLEIAICCLKDNWNNNMTCETSQLVKSVTDSIKTAKEMGCSSLIAMSGFVQTKVDTQKNIIIENLKRISDIAVKENVTINLEALNSLVDHKGYYLDSSYVGFEIIKSVNCPNIKLLFDIYHMQIMEGNIIYNINENINLIGHFHSAGVPGRNEHFNGESDYPNILKSIKKTQYDKYFGLEYWTTYDDEKSIKDVLKHLKG
jgi:hydroxypyruvate isomerase